MTDSRQNGFSVDLGLAHYRSRLAQIAEYLNQKKLDGILLLDAYTIMWATGFFHIPNERPLGLFIDADGGEPIFFAPLLEKEHVEELGLGRVECYWEYPGETPAPIWMVEQIPAQRLAVDEINVRHLASLQAIKPDLVLDDGVAQMRFIKSEAEIELSRRAARYADFALEVGRAYVESEFSRGVSEIEIVAHVQSQTTAKMRSELDALTNFYRGAVALTAHSGARAALPHGQPGPHRVEAGDTLIIGVGVRVGGYHAESGCTFVVGEPSRDQLDALEATWACDEAAVEALRPGVTASRVNEIALETLSLRGFGDGIRHRIGHGMGVQGHEAPWLAPGDGTVLHSGMLFSNEPGIYRPGRDGYRIIDSMLVTASGGERLSRYLSDHGPDDRVIDV